MHNCTGAGFHDFARSAKREHLAASDRSTACELFLWAVAEGVGLKNCSWLFNVDPVSESWQWKNKSTRPDARGRVEQPRCRYSCPTERHLPHAPNFIGIVQASFAALQAF
jgi:hypothetical protein